MNPIFTNFERGLNFELYSHAGLEWLSDISIAPGWSKQTDSLNTHE